MTGAMTGGSGAIGSMRRVASIATMASRLETFQKVLPVIHAQVDHVFIYLDGYDATPDFLKRFDRISVYRAEEVGNLHVCSRFLCLQELAAPTVVVTIDDDIIYPADYVSRLTAALQRLDGKAVVGVHGRIFIPPHESYVRDAYWLGYSTALAQPCHVHELGTGTCGFISSNLDVDPRKWDRHNMNDITVAIEAQRRGLPRIAVARTAGWLKPYAQAQPDSIWRKTMRDDSEQSRRMRALLTLYAAKPEQAPLRPDDALAAPVAPVS
jgi:hypothetical protein